MLLWALGSCISLTWCYCSFWICIPRSGCAGSYGNSVVSFFEKPPYCFSTVAASVYIPTNSVWGFPFLHILASICYSCSLWWWPFWQVWGDNLIVLLIDVSLMISDAEHLFLCLSAIGMGKTIPKPTMKRCFSFPWVSKSGPFLKTHEKCSVSLLVQDIDSGNDSDVLFSSVR